MRIVISLLTILAVSFPAHARVTAYLTGSAADVMPALHGPVLNLGGGGTDIDAALQEMIDQARGCTGAGLAIQGEFVYDACVASATSVDVLANPYHRSATFTRGFFNWPFMSDTLTDSHFVARDRMGRLMGFLARQIQDGYATTALGVAVDEETSVVVDKNGMAKVMGNGTDYFVLADHTPEQCVAKRPMSFSDYRIWKVGPGQTFDLAKRPELGAYTISVNNGVLSGNPY